MRNKLIAGLVLALVIPSLALAAKPPAPPGQSGAKGKAAPKVLYVLKGTLSAYTAATSGSPGSITIQIAKANHYAKFLKTSPATSLTFSFTTSAKVVIYNHGTNVVNGDVGIVKVKALKNVASPSLATVTAALQAGTVTQIIDQHAAPTP